MTTLPQASKAALPALDADLEQAVSYARAEKQSATRRPYHSDFTLFESWCTERGIVALPAEPETVAAFLAFEANRGIRPSTITRRAASIRYAHKLRGNEPPTNSEAVRATLRGIRRSTGTAKVRKAPILAETARAMAQAAPDGLKGLRDQALLLLGFAGAFRRSELVALDVADLVETTEGLRVTIRHSKTDQEGEGVTIAISRGDVACPARALREGLDAAGIEAGPIFRPINKAG